MEQKKYEGSCYIGVVGSESENGECRDSIEAIIRRPDDEYAGHIRATKGYEARQMHLNNWYDNTIHPFMLLLDHDMKFPPETLERLRSHGLPYLSGSYMRRRFNPVAPVWYDYGPAGVMPMIPFTTPPMENTLYKLGASGWGCILIHRDVITETRKILKGEQDIIEDDMDVYPYDLKEVMAGREQLRPLRCLKDIVGSDIRFPFYARLAGFDLIGDSGVECEHMVNYPVSGSDYGQQSAKTVQSIAIQIAQQTTQERKRIDDALAALSQKPALNKSCWKCEAPAGPEQALCLSCEARL